MYLVYRIKNGLPFLLFLPNYHRQRFFINNKTLTSKVKRQSKIKKIHSRRRFPFDYNHSLHIVIDVRLGTYKGFQHSRLNTLFKWNGWIESIDRLIRLSNIWQKLLTYISVLPVYYWNIKLNIGPIQENKWLLSAF